MKPVGRREAQRQRARDLPALRALEPGDEVRGEVALDQLSHVGGRLAAVYFMDREREGLGLPPDIFGQAAIALDQMSQAQRGVAAVVVDAVAFLPPRQIGVLVAAGTIAEGRGGTSQMA